MAYSISAEGAPAAVPDFDTLFETYQTEALRAAYLICATGQTPRTLCRTPSSNAMSP